MQWHIFYYAFPCGKDGMHACMYLTPHADIISLIDKYENLNDLSPKPLI
jgi:hypothetical protein